MDMRIRGTRAECAAFIKIVRESVPEEYIRSISKFYPDTRKCSYSNEGRVYISFRETIAQIDDGRLLKGGSDW